MHLPINLTVGVKVQTSHTNVKNIPRMHDGPHTFLAMLAYFPLITASQL